MASSSSPAAAPCRFLSPLAATASRDLLPFPTTTRRRLLLSAAAMAASSSCKFIDSHLHVWASPQQAKEGYAYFPGQETTLRGDADFLLECMSEAGVDGALIVQPINHMFDHSLVTSVLKKYPSKFIGCCLANPADDGSGIKQLEHLIVQEKYRAVRFNPNLWPSGQKMTNEVGRSLFAKAGELGAPVGIMTMKGIGLYIQEIEELCVEYPATTVILDHMAFCKPPTNDEEEKAFSSFLNLSRFPQVYVKYSALFRITREAYPYEDTAQLLSRVISNYGASRIMWGSDFPYVVPECGYKGAKEAVSHVAGKIPVSPSDLEWILGKTVSQLFQGRKIVDLSVEDLLDYHQIVSKIFRSEQDGYGFYNSYALHKGFTVRRCYVERDTVTKEICLRKFVCGRQGFHEDKHRNKAIKKRKPRNISRCGCLAKMVIALNKQTGQWYVKDSIDDHNHPLASPDLSCLLRSHRQISNEQKAEIIEMEIAGIRKHQIMNILEMQYGGYDKVGCTSRDLYNFCSRYKLKAIERGDAETVIRHMKERHERDADFFFKYVLDEEGHLKHLFWSDNQSRLDYEAFGDVVVFDSTYQTNRYNLPFVPFVGVNHHRSTVVFGCAIISYETSEAYEWLLQTFLTAMAQKHPISVITDGDLAMQKAIRIVLPHSNHRLCTWHIEQNIIRNLHNSKISQEFRRFVYDRCPIQEIERKWDEFLEKNKISSKHEWLYQMHQMRHLWCAAYQVGRCFLGLSTNQRSESLNSKLHTHLDRKMALFDMLQHYEHCLSTLLRNEAMLDAMASQSIPFTETYADPMEKYAANVYTPPVFALVKEKINSVGNYAIREILDGVI